MKFFIIFLNIFSFNSFSSEIDEMKISVKGLESYDGDKYKSGVELSTKYSLIDGRERTLKHLLSDTAEQDLNRLQKENEIFHESISIKEVLNIQFNEKLYATRKQLSSKLQSRFKILDRKSLTSSSDLGDVLSLENDIIMNDLEMKKLSMVKKSVKGELLPLKKIKEQLVKYSGEIGNFKSRFTEYEYELDKLNKERIIDSYELSLRQNDTDDFGEDIRLGFQINFNIGTDKKRANVENKKFIESKLKNHKENFKKQNELNTLYNEIIFEINSLEELKKMKSLRRLKSMTRNKKFLKSLTRNDKLSLGVERLKLELVLLEKEQDIYFKIIDYGILSNTRYNIIKGKV